jgi:hypothetical protein
MIRKIAVNEKVATRVVGPSNQQQQKLSTTFNTSNQLNTHHEFTNPVHHNCLHIPKHTCSPLQLDLSYRPLSVTQFGLLHEPKRPRHLIYFDSHKHRSAYFEMRKTSPPQDFEIHVDPSCLADNAEADAIMSPERISNESSSTVIHHDTWTEEELKNEIPATNGESSEESMEKDPEEEKENSPPPIDIDVKENNAVSEPEIVDEKHEQDELEDDTEHMDATTEEDDKEREALDRQLERIEAEIQAAARTVVANIQNEHYDENENSVLSAQTDDSYFTETDLAHDETEGTPEDKDDSFISDHDAASERHSDQEGGDSSSHHDGDVDDDVFSNSDQSKRSSMNSLHSSNGHQKLLTSPTVGEEAASANEGGPISRMPSVASYIHTPTAAADHTPSKVLSRPPFRTPSSVRAMQMSSPTASLFSSPRSAKRHLPTVSRIGTPNSQYSPSKRTPTRLKPRKAAPLVLLHVTVMPLQWPYSYLMSLAEVPESLQHVKQSWKLLQDKIGDTVLERGILLSHPQESYEVLEERLYEALELPVRPRARILKCGHYMGPLDLETPSSDEESEFFEGADIRDGRKWCDICGRDVRVEEVGDLPRGEKRFTVKIYASNGLMRAGAWEAAWREMERVDVELEPFVDSNLRAELEHLAAVHPQEVQPEEAEVDDGFEDEEVIEHVHEQSNEQERQVQERQIQEHQLQERLLQERQLQELQVQDARARENEEMIARMAREDEMKQRIIEEDDMRKRMAEEDEMRNLMAKEEELKQRMAEEEAMRQRMNEQEAMRLNEERMRQIYGQEAERSYSRRTSSRSSVHDDSSFVELLLAAFKVVLRDSRNVTIGILSVLVLLLALSTKTTNNPPLPMIMETASVPQITTTIFKEAPVASVENIRTLEQIQSISTTAESVSQVTTTVIREYTVTEKAPIATAETSEALTTSVSISQVTTTVFREKTVTERIPAPSSIATSVDPCEPTVSTKNKLPVVESKAVEVEVEQEQDIEPPLGASEEVVDTDNHTAMVQDAISEAELELPSEEDHPSTNEEPTQKLLVLDHDQDSAIDQPNTEDQLTDLTTEDSPVSPEQTPHFDEPELTTEDSPISPEQTPPQNEI